jgi:hypothetical protein
VPGLIVLGDGLPLEDRGGCRQEGLGDDFATPLGDFEDPWLGFISNWCTRAARRSLWAICARLSCSSAWNMLFVSRECKLGVRDKVGTAWGILEM